MTHSVTVNHTFEAGHRLPQLAGKCQSLHGHSWAVEVEVSAPSLSTSGTIVEFGRLKKVLREFVDTNLDHGLMLGGSDTLVPLLSRHGKVFVFDAAPFPPYDSVLNPSPYTEGLSWPSVESVAELLARMMVDKLTECAPVDGAHVSRVTVSETSTNTASWTAPRPVTIGTATIDVDLVAALESGKA